MKKVFVVLVLIVVVIGAFLYFPRRGANIAQNAATLAILNTAIEGARAGAAFAPALDGAERGREQKRAFRDAGRDLE